MRTNFRDRFLITEQDTYVSLWVGGEVEIPNDVCGMDVSLLVGTFNTRAEAQAVIETLVRAFLDTHTER